MKKKLTFMLSVLLVLCLFAGCASARSGEASPPSKDKPLLAAVKQLYI